MDLSWWHYLLMGIGVYAIVRGLAKSIVKAADIDATQTAWTRPKLPMPEFSPGERRFEGDLVKPGVRNRMIHQWDRTKVFDWLDALANRLRPEVSDQRMLELERLIKANPNVIPPVHGELTLAAREVPTDSIGHHKPEYVTDWKFFYAVEARHCIGRGGYNVMGVEPVDYDNPLPDEIVVGLNRLAADQDFAPAAVNMWHHINENKLSLEPYVDIAEQELYLRYFCSLGADGAHYQIAVNLLIFYLWAPYQREDDGYVAAALDRLKHYSVDDYSYYYEKLRSFDYIHDINDKSVSRGGMIQDMKQMEDVTLN